MGDRRNISTIFDLAMDGSEWSVSRLGRVTRRKRHPLYPFYGRLVGPQSRYRRCGAEKNTKWFKYDRDN
jgi:hypothetical protein